MARKKVYARLRIEKLENYIGFYEATRQVDAVVALMRLAREIGAELDQQSIERSYEQTQNELKRRKTGA